MLQLPSGAVPVPEAGSVSMRLYPHNELRPPVVDELCAQAVLAADGGFDGVMTSEHHGGFAGYLPNPLQVTGWLLEAMRTGWCRAVPDAPAAAARRAGGRGDRLAGARGFPVGSGRRGRRLAADFEVMEVPLRREGGPFRRRCLRLVTPCSVAMPSATSPVTRRSCLRGAPVTPVVSTAMSPGGPPGGGEPDAGLVTRAATVPARLGAVTMPTSRPAAPARRILIRRVWLGDPPRRPSTANSTCTAATARRRPSSTGGTTASCAASTPARCRRGPRLRPPRLGR